MAREFTYMSRHSILMDNSILDVLQLYGVAKEEFPYNFSQLTDCENCDNCRFAGSSECSGECRAITAYESEQDYTCFPTEEEADEWDTLFVS